MNIKEICEKYKISQSGLARRFGIPLRTVQGWYLGERKPPEYVVSMINELLALDPLMSDERVGELLAEGLRRKTEDKLKAVKAITQGDKTVKEVAAELGYTERTVYMWVREYEAVRLFRDK